MRSPTPSFTATFTGTPYPFGGTTPKILKTIRLGAITFSDSARLRTVICEFSPIFQNTSFPEAFPLFFRTRAFLKRFPYCRYTGKLSRDARE
jgi:hypothetical protein